MLTQRSLQSFKMTISVIIACLVFASSTGPISAAKVSENTQEKEERERLERRGKVEKAKREIESRLKQSSPATMPTDHQTRLINELAAAEINYDAAKRNRDKNRPGFIIALVDLTDANFANKEYEQASRFASQAYSQYELLNTTSSDEPKCRDALWKVVGMLPTNEFQPKFEKLFRISEAKTSATQHDATANISGIPNAQERIDLDGHFDKEKFYKAAVDIRAAARGHNDESLYWFLDQYGRQCEIQNDIGEAEKAFVWMRNLNFSPKTAQNAATAKVRLARFYVDHNQFEKAEAAWPELLKLISPQMHSMVVGEFAWLGTNYIDAAHLPDADKIASAMLAAGGDTIVSSMSSVTNKLIESYIDNLSFEKAQVLLIKRVKASETCQRDYAAFVVRLQLSNIDLALGQVAESNRLFDEVKKLTALKGRDFDKILEDREKLVQALKK